MKSDFKEAKISILILAILLFVSVFICIFAAMFTSMGYKAYRNANAERSDRAVIVLDRGTAARIRVPSRTEYPKRI